MTTGYIAIDWGSTHLRAWRYRDGECIDSRQSDAGITRLNGESPAAILARITDGWRDATTPVLMAGMVGSNAGWQEAPYLPCPLPLSAIGRQLMPVADNVWIVPGIRSPGTKNPNVMRGDETQLLGAAQLAPATLYVMPGTHCKWVFTHHHKITHFQTVMTGELHALLLRHSLIGNGLPEQTPSPSAFEDGLATGLDNPAILPRLFEVRAAHVLGALPRDAVSDYLSGLLIGADVATMTADADRQLSITLVASDGLSRRYQQAFHAIGRRVQAISGDEAFQAGIRSIAYAMANPTSADSDSARH
ncbi:2-dehydro-3-deoxygalactonokinase [Shimwellia pseudoproteus]|uniref:2-dehydro-3-deoxygalactonokinase n=1 Tax=Shimwellia pseudoproteus TaxID=570012 RepID=UPI0018EAD162|nr:2-dehydro-3-deoxygalactonokinase [Shimwellia pseudoproteus]MBJ3816799.1 2-dehydro-3-deoxygalactonokinase [Shimwellia pseudoproteus]